MLGFSRTRWICFVRQNLAAFREMCGLAPSMIMITGRSMLFLVRCRSKSLKTSTQRSVLIYPLGLTENCQAPGKDHNVQLKIKSCNAIFLPDFPSVDRCLSLIGAMLRTPLQMTLGGTRLPLAEHRQETVICSLLSPLILQRTLVFIAASTLWESDPTYRRNQCKSKKE